jgi:hypothetical protein
MLTILEKCTKCRAVPGPPGERRTGRVQDPPDGLADIGRLGSGVLSASQRGRVLAAEQAEVVHERHPGRPSERWTVHFRCYTATSRRSAGSESPGCPADVTSVGASRRPSRHSRFGYSGSVFFSYLFLVSDSSGKSLISPVVLPPSLRSPPLPPATAKDLPSGEKESVETGMV